MDLEDSEQLLRSKPDAAGRSRLHSWQREPNAPAYEQSTAVSYAGRSKEPPRGESVTGPVAELTLLRLVDRFSVIQDGLQCRMELGLCLKCRSQRANDQPQRVLE